MLSRRLGGRGLARGLPPRCSPTAPAPRAARPASTSSTTAAWAGSATPTRRRCWRWPAPATPTPASSWPASGPTSPPPTNPTPASSTSSSTASRRSPPRSRPSSPTSIAHAANSAAVFRDRRSHFDMARCGVAVYGLDPFQGDPAERGLRAGALAALLRRRRQALRGRRQRRLRADAGGRRRETWVGVVPLGYGDGVRRGLTNNAEVLVRGRRHPLVGTVSMDNVTIDLGPETEVEPGDEAVLIGAQGEEAIRAEEVAARLEHDQLRGHLRDLGPGAAARRRERALAERLGAAAAGRRWRAAARWASGEGVWIVGGAVRDAALGREVADLDLAVAGDPGAGGQGDRRASSASTPSSSRPSSAPGASSPRDRGWQVDVDRAARRDDRGRPGRARLHDRRRRRAARRRRADRPLRRPRRPRARRPARGRRAQLRAPTRCACCARARLAAELGLEIDPGTVALARAAAARAAEPAGERQLAELRQLLGGPDPLRGLAPARRARADRRRPARAGGAARGRAGPQPPPRRPRPHARRARAHARGRGATSSASPASAPPRCAALLAEPLADEMSRGTALRFGALLHDIGKPATRAERDGFVGFRGHDRVGAEIVGEICGRLRASRRLTRHLQGADPAPPAARLPDPRGAAAAAPRPRVPARDRAGRRRRHPAHRRRPALRPRRRPARQPRRWSRPTSPWPGRCSPPRSTGAATARRRRCCAATSSPPSWASTQGPELGELLAELEAAQYAGEVSDRDEASSTPARLRG